MLRSMITPTIEVSPAIAERLDRAVVGWLTTVTPDDQPQTSPVWFVWQDGRIIVYSLAAAPRVRNIRANPRIAFNLDSDGQGDDVVTFEGEAVLDVTGPASTRLPDYQAKYLRLIRRNGWTPEEFARDYPQRIVITPTRLRAY